MKKIHFENTQDRLDFIRGRHTEIVPIEVELVDSKKTKKKSAKKKENEDEVQAD